MVEDKFIRDLLFFVVLPTCLIFFAGLIAGLVVLFKPSLWKYLYYEKEQEKMG